METNFETRSGIRTTEFWSTLVLNLIGIAQLVTSSINVDNKYVIIGMAIITGLYNGSRGLAKANVPNAGPLPELVGSSEEPPEDVGEPLVEAVPGPNRPKAV